ncbi:MAG: hydrogenase formation protein HypD [Theionarchaea archaeon]|nr:hydrogenase formation protein HypD [Theionarchaea archaeon]MBU7001067.1 hydrogenase formation protein HypD [Theionarchaea archaeon]MBU7020556.1 hydrogenase formation protein HypD [Theionarchaea archaeon]MBU7034177.1 hydrogenase formation protein HypD [Theionarchaea archaeon]MBU7039279.1 hydrogenase formation protein HypD [Theionarchaea archaeon]
MAGIAPMLQDIRAAASSLPHVKIMHVCGTHEQSIVQYGLRSLLPDTVEIIAGPGCPVCITPKYDIDVAVFLAKRGTLVTTFGDMYKVPSTESLSDARSRGADIRIVYSISNAVELAKKNPGREVVHFGIGFETTAPTTALVVQDAPENFSVLCCHRLIPPALLFLLGLGAIDIQGFIDPGHVSAIIGSRPYRAISENYRVPQVVAGFEAEDLVKSVLMVLNQLQEGRAEVENEYTRVVKEEGNVLAQQVMAEVFQVVDADWRALPRIPGSGYELSDKYGDWNARKKFEGLLEDFVYVADEPRGCRCGEVLRGLVYPEECPLFRKVCTPVNPVGPCMVSREGSCSIKYRYSRE